MSRSCISLAVLLMSIVLVASPAWAGDDQTEAQAKSVTLSQLMKTPESFRAVPCEFTLTFHQFTQVYNPYFTRFVPERFLNFAAWGDEQEIWKVEEYSRDFPFLFVSKGAKNLTDFLKLERFDRVQVVGEIKDIFKGKPWIELYSVKPLDGKITEKSLVHRVRGDMAMKKNRPRIAVKEYNLALSQKELPDAFAYGVLKDLGMALYRTRDFASARKVFAKLAKLQPEDKDSKVLAAQCASRETAHMKKMEAEAMARATASNAAEPKPEEVPAPVAPEEAAPGDGSAKEEAGGKIVTAPHRK